LFYLTAIAFEIIKTIQKQ